MRVELDFYTLKKGEVLTFENITLEKTDARTIVITTTATKEAIE